MFSWLILFVKPYLNGLTTMKNIYKFRRVDSGLYTIERWNGNNWQYLQQIKDKRNLLKNFLLVYVRRWTNIEDELISVQPVEKL